MKDADGQQSFKTWTTQPLTKDKLIRSFLMQNVISPHILHLLGKLI